MNSFGHARDETLTLHPTVKPVSLIADAIRDCSHHNDLVLDIFAGSGSTLIAAEVSGRAARLLELDPLYCDTIIKRWEMMSNGTAVHSQTWQTYAERIGQNHLKEEKAGVDYKLTTMTKGMKS